MLPVDQRSPLELEDGETFVDGALMLDPVWLSEQIALRGLRWSTDDRRVLTTLWWYSASVWTIAPTVASLILADEVLSAEPHDLRLHWLPDSRITGATSTAVVTGGERVLAAGASLRRLYDQVIPVLADVGGMRPRPLWAIAADALAGRLLWLGRATGDTQAATALLGPLTDVLGHPLPRARYTPAPQHVAPQVDRCSCCLLYLAPAGSMCTSCPRMRSLR